MIFNFNIFANILLFSGSATFFLGLFVLLRLGKSVKWFGALLLCISIWSIAYSLELASAELEQMLFWVHIQYIGISFLPATWLVFTLEFSNLKKWLTPSNLFLIFLFPVIAVVMIFTDQYHHLHYQRVYVSNDGPFPLLNIEPGLWYHIHTVYFYFALILGNYFLVRSYFIFRKQSRAIIIASLIPWLFNLLYLAGLRPYGAIDLTPFAFIITSTTIGFSILKFNLFTIIPVAHEKVIQNMHQALLIIDANGNIVDMNASMKQFIGIKEKNVIGKSGTDVFATSNEWLPWIYEINENKRDVMFGNKFYEISNTNLTDEKGRYTGHIFTAQDITERKDAENILHKQTDELLHLNQLKDKLFSIIAHDLRSPLASLIELLNLAKNGDLTEQEFRNFIDYVSENVEYTSDLLDNLLQWSKSQIKGENINPQSFDIFDLIQNKVRVFSKNARLKNISMINETQPGSFVFADKDMIRLVLRNLISNAIKFCNENDSISISFKNQGEYSTISVTDTGVGISKESLNKLFHNTIFTTRGTRNEHGTGLGLMLCKEFVEKNGGRLEVESELGKGSTFRFTLKSN